MTTKQESASQAEQASAPCCPSGADGQPCCAPEAATSAAESTLPISMQAFGTLMRVTSSAGVIDARTKELIVFALAVLSKCSPCVSAHLKHALNMGISQDELDEAAWCAVSMGGAPVKMFYQEALRNARGGSGCC